MLISFIRCYYCGKVDEKERILARSCCTCSSRRMTETTLTTFQLYWFILWHPSYLIKALKEEYSWKK